MLDSLDASMFIGYIWKFVSENAENFVFAFEKIGKFYLIKHTG
jgi:hypothetical protein